MRRAWAFGLAALGLMPAPASALVEFRGEIRLASEILAIDVQESDTSAAGPVADSISRIEGPGAVGNGNTGAAYDAEAGLLRASASIRVVAPGTLAPSISIDSGTRGTAQWRDTVTISAPGLTGTLGSFVPRIRFSGSLAGDAAGTDPPFESFIESSGLLSFDGGTGSFQQRSRTLRSYAGQAGQVTGDPFGTWTLAPVPFVFGSAFPLALTLDATTFARTVEGGVTDGFADFSSTAEWRGIAAVRDASETSLSVYTVTSESGFDYAVPEPHAALLGAAAAAALGALRRPRARRQPATSSSRIR